MNKLIPIIIAGIILAGMTIFYLRSIEQQTVVKIGYLDLPSSSLPLFVALENKYFEKHGIKIETEKFASSNPLAEALINGNIDVAVGPSSVPLYAIELKSPGNFKVFMTHKGSLKQPFSQILVRADSPIQNISELEGGTLALFPGSTALALSKVVLRNMGQEHLNVTLTSMAPNLWKAALQSQDRFAILAYEPWATQLLEDGSARILVERPYEQYVIDGATFSSTAFSKSFLARHPDLAKKIVTVFEEAVDFIEKNPKDSRLMMLKYTNIDENVALKTSVAEFDVGKNIDLKNYQRYADILYNEGELPNRLDVTSMVYSPET